MVDLEQYIVVWKGRSLALASNFHKIKFLSGDSQIMQAELVRDACLDFILEVEMNYELIRRAFICREEEEYDVRVDEIRMLDFVKRPWPFNSGACVHRVHMKAELVKDASVWARQATEYEAVLLMAQKELTNEARVTIGKLIKTYKVSGRR